MRGVRCVIFIIIIFSVMLFCSSCWDSKDMEHMFFIQSIGFDYNEDDDTYTVHAKIVNFGEVETAQEEGGGDDAPDVKIGIGTGQTIVDAFHDVYMYTQRSVYFGHLSAIVFSESVMQKDVQEMIEAGARFNEVRDTLWVYGTSEPLPEILTTLPILQTQTIFSVLADPMDSYAQSSLVAPMRLHEFRKALNEPGKTTAIPNVSLSPGRWYSEEGGGPEIGINGAHFFQNMQWKGKLVEGDIEGFPWTQDKMNRAPLVIPTDTGSEITVILVNPEMNVEVNTDSDPVSFRVHLSIDAEVIEALGNMKEAELERRAEEQMESTLQDLYERAAEQQMDVFLLSYHLYRNDPHEWKTATGEDGMLPLSSEHLDEITVQVDITESGERKLPK